MRLHDAWCGVFLRFQVDGYKQELVKINKNIMVLSRVMRKYNSVTYEVGQAKAEQAAGMFGLAAGQPAASCPSRVAKPLAKPLTGGGGLLATPGHSSLLLVFPYHLVPAISYSYSALRPTRYQRRASALHRPASTPILHPGRFQPLASVSEFRGSDVPACCWFGSSASARRGMRSRSAFPHVELYRYRKRSSREGISWALLLGRTAAR